ncbi:hypothetical protein DPMN_045615 [Dreissena polymorpha]|uniref:Uncharacterized protein n=1 Tax=Dreissena polymorpha TaxID=45954 RepID=A0A9D4I1J4_DREPO|nr:hypothetical protein DPMN_045615 [Dreissena polymorpha]
MLQKLFQLGSANCSLSTRVQWRQSLKTKRLPDCSKRVTISAARLVSARNTVTCTRRSTRLMTAQDTRSTTSCRLGQTSCKMTLVFRSNTRTRRARGCWATSSEVCEKCLDCKLDHIHITIMNSVTEV